MIMVLDRLKSFVGRLQWTNHASHQLRQRLNSKYRDGGIFNPYKLGEWKGVMPVFDPEDNKKNAYYKKQWNLEDYKGQKFHIFFWIHSNRVVELIIDWREEEPKVVTAIVIMGKTIRKKVNTFYPQYKLIKEGS